MSTPAATTMPGTTVQADPTAMPGAAITEQVSADPVSPVMPTPVATAPVETPEPVAEAPMASTSTTPMMGGVASTPAEAPMGAPVAADDTNQAA